MARPYKYKITKNSPIFQKELNKMGISIRTTQKEMEDKIHRNVLHGYMIRRVAPCLKNFLYIYDYLISKGVEIDMRNLAVDFLKSNKQHNKK